MIYIGLPQWCILNGCGWGSPALKSMPATLLRGGQHHALRPAETRGCPALREQTTDDFRFCFKFPATISLRQHYGIAMI